MFQGLLAAADAPAPAASAESPGEAEELLGALVGALFSLRGDPWVAVTAAVPVELQARIDRCLGWS
jgi:hypothetical protein